MQITNRPTDDFLTVTTCKGFESIAFSEIIYFKADRKHTFIYMKDKPNPQRVFLSISSLENILPTDRIFAYYRTFMITNL